MSSILSESEILLSVLNDMDDGIELSCSIELLLKKFHFTFK